MKQNIVYLAAPYSDDKEEIREMRYEQITRVFAKLLEQNINVFSPISMSHPAVKYLSYPDAIPHSQWLKFDMAFLGFVNEMYVLQLEGWEESKGVLMEIEFAVENDIPITWLDPNDYLI